jgi:hypothetical protein
MVKEGVGGWTKCLSFERAYAYHSKTGTSEAHRLYRMTVTRQKGLDILAVAYGRTSDEEWETAYAALHTKGIMPGSAYDAFVRGDEAEAA